MSFENPSNLTAPGDSGGAVDISPLVTGTNLVEQRNGANAQTFNVYGSHTDASNYERLAFTQDGAGTCTIAAQTLGSGTDNVNLNILAAGSGAFMAGTASDTDQFLYLNGNATVIGATSWSTRSTLVGRKSTGGYYSTALGWSADCPASTGAAIGAFADCEHNASLALPRGQHNSQNKHFPRIQCLYLETTDATQDAMEAPGQAAGDTIPCTIASNRSATISGTVIALQDDNTETASWQIHATVQNNAGTMTLVGSNVTAINNNADAWACEVAINDTDDSWEVLVTGEASTTIRWGAELMVNEMSH